MRAAELLDVTPIVRVPANQPHVILRLMDTGAQGCHVPWIGDAAEADAAVRSVKYAPRGERGLAGVRAADYGQRGSLGEYVRKANEETLVVVHVETASAVEQVDDIAAVDGVDVVFLGPADLSQSLGVPGEMRHPVVLEHWSARPTATLAAGKALGVTVPDAEAARAWIERGATYVTTPLESMLARGHERAPRRDEAWRRTRSVPSSPRPRATTARTTGSSPTRSTRRSAARSSATTSARTTGSRCPSWSGSQTQLELGAGVRLLDVALRRRRAGAASRAS